MTSVYGKCSFWTSPSRLFTLFSLRLRVLQSLEPQSIDFRLWVEKKPRSRRGPLAAGHSCDALLPYQELRMLACVSVPDSLSSSHGRQRKVLLTHTAQDNSNFVGTGASHRLSGPRSQGKLSPECRLAKYQQAFGSWVAGRIPDIGVQIHPAPGLVRLEKTPKVHLYSQMGNCCYVRFGHDRERSLWSGV